MTINAGFGRLTRWAGVRILLYIVAIIAVLALTKIVTAPLIPPKGAPYHLELQAAANLFSAIALLVAYAWTVRWIERRHADELDIRPGAIPFLAGIVLGALLMATVYLILNALGLVRFTPGTGLEGLASGLVGFFAAAVLEELVMRVILFRIVEQVAGTTTALLFSAILFGLLHGFNPGATIVSTGAIAIEAGLLLAIAYALTRNIWLVVGIHLAWNFTEGDIFGAQVSGSAGAYSWVRTILSGPGILTGGAFGPEASIVAVLVCLAAAIAIGALVVRRGGWQPRRLNWSLA